jgi:hypothetical protein
MTTCPNAWISASTFLTGIRMNKTTFSEVSSLKTRCGSTTKIQRANARVWIGNITISQQNKVQNATNSKKGDFLFTTTGTQAL